MAHPGKPWVGYAPPLPCPACSVMLFGFTEPESPAICINCRAIVIISVEVVDDPVELMKPVIFLRRPSEDEELKFLASPRMQALIARAAEYHRVYGPPNASPESR